MPRWTAQILGAACVCPDPGKLEMEMALKYVCFSIYMSVCQKETLSVNIIWEDVLFMVLCFYLHLPSYTFPPLTSFYAPPKEIVGIQVL